jgi:hypothetical protein
MKKKKIMIIFWKLKLMIIIIKILKIVK